MKKLANAWNHVCRVTNGLAIFAAHIMALGLLAALMGWISMPDSKTLVFALVISLMAHSHPPRKKK